MRGDCSELIPATPREGFARVFTWYTRRLLRKRFHRVHITPRSTAMLAELDEFDGPAVMCCTHASWWDPLVALHFQRGLLGRRIHFSPIDFQQLRRFGFFRKLGLFGIDPDSASSVAAMKEYIDGLRRVHPRLTLGITPQGRFTDVREPIRIRPGAAAVAAGMPNVRVVVAAIEYAFWQDARPSVFVHAMEVEPPTRRSTTGWHRAIQSSMQRAADELAQLVIAREPAAFTIAIGPKEGRASDVNRVHGLWMRLRGRSGEIGSSREEAAVGTSRDRGEHSVAAAGGGGR